MPYHWLEDVDEEFGMPVLSVTAKGQITLRREVLRHLGIGPGQKVDVSLLPDHAIALRPMAAVGALQDFFSSLDGQASRTVTLEEMDRAAQEGWAGRSS